MTKRSGFPKRRRFLSGLGLTVSWLLLASISWAIDEEKSRPAVVRPTADSSAARPQASSTRPSRSPSPSQAVSPQRSSSSTPSSGSSSAVQRQPTARDTRESPPGQWKPPGGSGGGGGGGWGGYHPSWGWGHRYPWYWNRHCWGWPSCWGWGWGYWGPYWHVPPPAYPVVSRTPYSPRSASTELGALNLVIKPKKVDVYVDGRFVGRAKDFDGYPGYLWLEEGDYEITLVRDGYVTFTDRIGVRTGNVVDVQLRLQPGLSTPPKMPQATLAVSVPETAQEQLASVQEETSSPAVVQDVRATPGQLELVVQPPDASVYLDGRLLGSGQELVDLHAGLIVDPGAHSLDMVRPGYEAQRLDFDVESGQTVSLQVTLLRDGE